MELVDYVRISETIPGWITGQDAEALAEASYRLPRAAVIVEIGSFFGRSAVLLAGPRKLRGSGRVHCIDPFDTSGDAFSVGHYRQIIDANGGGSLKDHFLRNVRAAGLDGWIFVHQACAAPAGRDWPGSPIDMLVLDGDQSPQGARESYLAWIPFLKPGGVLVLCNARDRLYDTGHDGHRLLAMNEVLPPKFNAIRQVGALRFAVRGGTGEGRSIRSMLERFGHAALFFPPLRPIRIALHNFRRWFG